MNQNVNQKNVGFHSQGQGSVSMQIQGAAEKPTFKECTFRFSEEQGSQGVPIATATVVVPASEATKWTVAFEAITVGETTVVQAAVGMPQGFALLTVTSEEVEVCTIRFGGEQQSVVMGNYDNATQQLRLDGQLKYETGELVPGGCEAIEGQSPAQFEAEYKLSIEKEGEKEQKFTVE